MVVAEQVNLPPVAVGLIAAAITVTVAVQEDELPDASVTVSVTLFSPRLEQSKEKGVTVLETIPQLSVLLSSTSAAAIINGLLVKSTVIFLQMAIGSVLSTIVTIAEHEDELPDESVTVRVTVFAPRLLQ